MRVALLSHRGGNIGHDFMAAAWEHIAQTAFGADVTIVHVEQHRPFDVYPRTSRVRRRAALPGELGRRARWEVAGPAGSAAAWPAASRTPEVDLAVACGGPNLVPGVGRTLEMNLMFPHLHGAFASRGIPVVDAAVGSGFPFEHLPDRIEDADDRLYYERLFAVTTRSTVRDELAQRLWAELGRVTELIPCGALALRGARPPATTAGKGVIVNFQEAGANEDWGQAVDRERWAADIRHLVQRLRERHDVVMLCHNTWEAKLAARVAPDVPALVPTTVRDFLELAANAGAAVVNRIHAAIGLAGAGVPSVVVGTDSRLGTADQLGLPTHYVKHVTTDLLESEVEDLLGRREAERHRLDALREQTVGRHADVLRSAIS
jgi:hypothetical protein